MVELTSKQRKILEKAAHGFEPEVIVGQNGVTPSLVQAVGEQLRQHELIKVKFNEFKEDKRELATQIAAENGATLVRIIGNIAILYRESEESEKRRYAKQLSNVAGRTKAL